MKISIIVFAVTTTTNECQFQDVAEGFWDVGKKLTITVFMKMSKHASILT